MTLPATCTFLVVTGTMRSGTSLMAELLYSRAYGRQCHPELAFANDSFDPLRDLVYAVRERVLPGSGMGHPAGDIVADGEMIRRCAEQLDFAPRPGETLAAEIRRRIAAIAPVSGLPTVVGTKSTDIFGEFDIVRSLFPAAKLVVTVRDPRDVLASNIRRVGEKLPLDGLTVVTSVLNLQVFLGDRAGDPDILAIRYEDLVADPRGTIVKVLGFAGLDPSRYDWSALAEARVAANSSYSGNPGSGFVLGTGVTAASIGRYREVLSPLYIQAVERLLGAFMAEHGYALDAPAHDDFESEYLNCWLPFLYKRSRVAGLSICGLRRKMDVDGLGPCADDLERRMQWTDVLIKGGRDMEDLLDGEAALSHACHALRRSFAQRIREFQSRAEAGDWRGAEEAAMEAVAGEQNAGRLIRMCGNLLSVHGSTDQLLGYLGWCLAAHEEQWRSVLPRRIAALVSQGLEQEAERDLLRLARAHDAAIAASSGDPRPRLSKVEQLCRLGGGKWAERLAEDVRLLEAGGPGQDPALASRIRKAIGSQQSLLRGRKGEN